jgi:hypothetical protein
VLPTRLGRLGPDSLGILQSCRHSACIISDPGAESDSGNHTRSHPLAGADPDVTADPDIGAKSDTVGYARAVTDEGSHAEADPNSAPLVSGGVIRRSRQGPRFSRRDFFSPD